MKSVNVGIFYLLTALSLIILTTESGYSQSATNDMSFERTGKNVVRIEGILHTGSYKKFIAQVNGDEREFIVNILGGDARDSMLIARYIHDKKIAITVDGVCFSACSQYLLPAASKITITDNSLVILHYYIYINLLKLAKNIIYLYQKFKMKFP